MGIRIANKDDYEIVKELSDALIKDSVYSKVFKDYSVTIDMFNQYVINLREKIIALVLEDDKVVGFGAFDVIPWLYSDAPIRIARVAYIYVKPEFRGKGYGKEIMEAFEYWGKQVSATHYSISKKTEGYSKVETIYMKEVN